MFNFLCYGSYTLTLIHTPRASYICVIRINKIYMARCMIRYQTRSAYHYCFSSLAIQNEQRWKWSTIRNDEHHQNFLTSQLYNRIYPHIPVFELVNKKRSFSFFLFIVILTLKHVFFGSDPLYNRFACWEFKLKFSNIHGHLFLIISCVIISEVILLPEYNNEFLKRFLNSFSNIQTSSGLNWIVMQHSKHVMDNKQKKILISHWSFTWNQTGQDRAKYRIKYFFRSFVVFTNTIGPYRIDQKMNWIDLNG